MVKKVSKELVVDVPWGKVALVTWGDPTHPPVLMIHGYMDSAATFIPLVEHLPDTHYYVAYDQPGHGKSDPFPVGTLLSYLHYTEVVRCVVMHMQWRRFDCITHSVGMFTATCYNAVYPNRISRLVNLDPANGFAMSFFTTHQPVQYMRRFCLPHFEKQYSKEAEICTYEEAVSSMMNIRGLKRDCAEIALSRVLVPIGDRKYRYSRDQRMKRVLGLLHRDMQMYIIKKNPPPMLTIRASNYSYKGVIYEKFLNDIMEELERDIPEYSVFTVHGGQDVHLTSPELVAPYVKEFLKKELRAKL